MKPRFLLAASLLFVLLTLAIRAGSSRFAPAVSAFEPGAESVQVPADCDGEPCDAVVRGHRAFFDRELDGLGANGRACADCHMATRPFPALACGCRGQVPTSRIAPPRGSERRRSVVPADRRG